MAASPTKLAPNPGTTDYVMIRCFIQYFGAHRILDTMIEMLREDYGSGRFEKEPIGKWIDALTIARMEGNLDK